MDLEKYVSTLEQSKKLQSLGVNIPSLLYWKCNQEQSIVVSQRDKEFIEKYLPGLSDYIPAYNVSELCFLIGKGTKAAENFWQWLIECNNSGLSATVGLRAVPLAGFVITQIEINALTLNENQN